MSYAVNTGHNQVDATHGLINSETVPPLKISAVVSSSQVILAMETNVINTDYITAHSYFTNDNNTVLWPNVPSEFAGHFGTSNFLFADGHVKSLKPLNTVSVAMGGGGSVNMWSYTNKDYDDTTDTIRTQTNKTNLVTLLTNATNFYK